ncbi:methylenetetrahydrofolate reductase C-terminal domain-containing protein [Rhizobium sp. FY34]|uniref:methylenetetrahydrofolate reductase C-terminal domain-containing protein n=1 Tax=Rhizobium sp. FY34 TaxID=2562309 RepID=UPI0010BF987B|nr:methylenetetrahydrofolate reductase C-terminal domain-containing protein [Rhizobium sp. FY34]
MADGKLQVGNAAPRAKAATGDYMPADVSPNRRVQRRYSIRLWSVRHARLLEWFYARFAKAFLLLHPLWKALGYQRVEAPVTFVEKHVKGLLFDCRMCGQCVLSSTGMSCPMNCPKQLRNGPCGGVRANGNCEVEPDMPCVWMKAWEGSRSMMAGDAIMAVQKPVNQSLRETSSWLRVTAQAASEADADRATKSQGT